MTGKLFFPRKLFLLSACAFLTVLVACGAPAATPSDSATAVVEPPPATATASVEIPATGEGEEPAPALPEFRYLILEYPPVIKAGSGSEVIILTLDVDAQGNITPTAQVDGNVVEGEVVEIPNLYATHSVTAEAYYQVAGLEVVPPGSTFQPLKQGERVTFTWSVRAQEVGTYGGTIWLFLNFESRSSGEKSRVAISAQIVEIEAVDFFGFSTNFVRTSGVVGSALGLIVGFPFFGDAVKYIWTRTKKGRRKPKEKT